MTLRSTSTSLLTLRPKVPFAPLLWQVRADLPILFRLILRLGVRVKSVRYLFWRTLATVLLRNPSALEAFGMNCYFFHYLRQHVAYVQRELTAYLASPAADDVLDTVVPPTAPTADGTVALLLLRAGEYRGATTSSRES